VDAANILRTTRLMSLFIEQVETKAKVKGKAEQQRVVVEHVDEAACGQAIVGTVTPRKEEDGWRRSAINREGLPGARHLR
jgi:hypothetical protein